MIITLEQTTHGIQVRFWESRNGRMMPPKQEGPLRQGVCVYCARASDQKYYLCRGSTTNCEHRVWLASKRLRGEA